MRYLKVLLFIYLVWVIPPVLAQKKSETNARVLSFVVNGTVSNPNIKKLYLNKVSFLTNKQLSTDAVQVKDGRFTLTGALESPALAYLSIKEDFKADPKSTFQFIIDEGEMTISINQQVSDAVFSGSRAQDDMVRFTAEQMPYSDKLNLLDQEAGKLIQSGISQDSVSTLFHRPFKDATRDLLAFQKSFILKNPNTFVSLLLIPSVANMTHNYFEADSLFKLLSPDLQSSGLADLVNKHLASQMKVSIGAVAPDFTMPDTSGKMVSLSSSRGKYVLLDFWAAWCGPCRQENPNLVNAFNTFKDRFTVFGVSLDKKKSDWLKAIQTDKLTWPQVSDLQQWHGEVARSYGITSIPRNFLLDPNGKIIARDLRGPDLMEKLLEIFQASN